MHVVADLGCGERHRHQAGHSGTDPFVKQRRVTELHPPENCCASRRTGWLQLHQATECRPLEVRPLTGSIGSAYRLHSGLTGRNQDEWELAYSTGRPAHARGMNP
jgi:hypothetical protein